MDLTVYNILDEATRTSFSSDILYIICAYAHPHFIPEQQAIISNEQILSYFSYRAFGGTFNGGTLKFQYESLCPLFARSTGSDEFFQLLSLENNGKLWNFKMFGPVRSAYEGGNFHVTVTFITSRHAIYKFITPILHNDVSDDGHFMFHSNVKGHTMDISTCMMKIVKALIDVNKYDDYLDYYAVMNKAQPENNFTRPQRLFLENRKEYTELARKWTCMYAIPYTTPRKQMK